MFGFVRGGHVEDNETPDETIVREVMEETGLSVEIISEKDENLANIKEDVSVLNNPYVVLCELVVDHYFGVRS
jgi:8-oxo-dGTP pyrophosphatase MutT (NUDIX family)